MSDIHNTQIIENSVNIINNAIEIITDMITQGFLKAGEKIPEKILNTKMGISKKTLDSAFKVLADEGAIDLVPNKGAFVAKINDTNIEELLEVLSGIESLAAQLACERASDDAIQEIEDLQVKMEQAYENNEKMVYFKLNQIIHKQLIKSSKNSELILLHNKITSKLYRVRYKSNKLSKGWNNAVMEHREILANLKNRDSKSIAFNMRNHFKSTWNKYNEASN